MEPKITWITGRLPEMTNVLIYWRDFGMDEGFRKAEGGRRKDASSDVHPSSFIPQPLLLWHSKSRLLGNLQPGDSLWLVTSGANLGHDEKQAGFLVGIWRVRSVVENPNDDPDYPRDDYRFRVIADAEHAITFSDPIPVDHVLRPAGADNAVSIGRFLQGPRKLRENTLRLLRAAAGPDLALKWLKGERMRAEG